MLEIRFNSLIFHKNAVVAEVDTRLDGFWISLSPLLGYLKFTRQDQSRFLLCEV